MAPRRAGDAAQVRALVPCSGSPEEDGAPDAPGGVTPLMAAAARGHEAVVEALLERGADAAKRDARGRRAAAHARLYAIGAEEEFRALKGGSQRDASWAFLQSMRDLGRRAAERWLGEHLANVGVRSTVDLAAFAGPALDPGPGGRLSAAA